MLAALAAAAALTGACAPADGMQAICGPVASEDLALIPGTRWLIASGLNVGPAAHLYLVDTRDKRARTAFPQSPARIGMQPSFRGTCPGPLKPASMSIDGLDIRPASGGNPPLLLAANHGDRHAIEFFSIDMRTDPVLTWVGCVPMPKGTLANAVVALADGGMLVSSFHDPLDKDAWSRMDRGEATGAVWEWHPATGWTLAHGGIAGANGIEVSADERTLYVSAWAASRLLAIDRIDGSRREVTLDFRPDNIHRTAGGALLIGGQRAAVRDIAACTASCPQPWLVARVDAKTGAASTLLSGDGSAAINYACGAIEVDGELFMTLRGEPRIAWHVLAQRPR